MHAPVVGIRTYFQGSRLAQMSDGTYCIIRDLGPVKGGKGLRHHETLLTLSVDALASKFIEPFRHLAKLLDDDGVRDAPQRQIIASFESNSPGIGGVAKV